MDQDKTDSVYRATEGYTVIVALKPEQGIRRVFVETDGGRSGFPKHLWSLFMKAE
jgi:hypothetical protein